MKPQSTTTIQFFVLFGRKYSWDSLVAAYLEARLGLILSNHDFTSVFAHNKQDFATIKDEKCTWVAEKPTSFRHTKK